MEDKEGRSMKVLEGSEDNTSWGNYVTGLKGMSKKENTSSKYL